MHFDLIEPLDHFLKDETRAVESSDAPTADWAKFPYNVLTCISICIVTGAPGVSRVHDDTTSKPSALGNIKLSRTKSGIAFKASVFRFLAATTRYGLHSLEFQQPH